MRAHSLYYYHKILHGSIHRLELLRLLFYSYYFYLLYHYVYKYNFYYCIHRLELLRLLQHGRHDRFCVQYAVQPALWCRAFSVREHSSQLLRREDAGRNGDRRRADKYIMIIGIKSRQMQARITVSAFKSRQMQARITVSAFKSRQMQARITVSAWEEINAPMDTPTNALAKNTTTNILTPTNTRPRTHLDAISVDEGLGSQGNSVGGLGGGGDS